MGGKSSKIKVVFLGLDGAGKTSVLARACGEGVSAPEPTKGFGVETVYRKKVELNVVDVAGAETTRGLWRHQYGDTQAVVYVVDSTDKDRMNEAAEELHRAAKDAELSKAVWLIFANKQDVDGAVGTDEITGLLRLKEINNVWKCQECSAASGEGIEEGLDWITAEVVKALKAAK